MSATAISLNSIPAGTYDVDPKHSGVGFEVRHMGIATVRGAFRNFSGRLVGTEDGPQLSGTVEVASIDTGEEQRDAHLAAPDFFDAQYNLGLLLVQLGHPDEAVSHFKEVLRMNPNDEEVKRNSVDWDRQGKRSLIV